MADVLYQVTVTKTVTVVTMAADAAEAEATAIAYAGGTRVAKPTVHVAIATAASDTRTLA